MNFRASAVTLTYAALASLWIVLSATLLDNAVVDPVLKTRIELLKGLAFVAITSGLLYILLRAFEGQRAGPSPAAPLRPLARPRVLLIFIGLALAVPLIGLSVYVLHAGQARQENFENLEAIAKLKAGQIEGWLAERQGDATSLAASAGFIERIESVRRTGNARDRALAINRLESMQRAFGYTAIQVFDVSGKELIYLGDKHEPPADTVALLKESLNSGAVRRGELQVGDAGAQHLHYAAPLFLGDGTAKTPVGVVVLHISPERFLFPVAQTWPTASASGEILLVRRDGDSVLFLNESRHRSGTAMSLRQPLTNTSLPAVRALISEALGATEGIDYRGVPVYAAFRPVADTDWRLLAKVDRSEALAGALSMALWVSAVALFALLIMGAALLSLWRAQRHADRLQNQAETDHLLRQFYDLPFIGMAIVSPVTRRWVKFNDRLCEIFGYTREELVQKSWAEMMHPDDLDPSIGQAEQMARGESDAYAFEKRFFRKDGLIVHVQLDVRCVRKSDGSVDYFVVTVQDITERTNAQRQILRLNGMYSALSRCSVAVAYAHGEQELFVEICNAVLDSGGMKMAWIGLVDESGKVVPAASAGDVDYLRDVQITVSLDDPYSHGPTGTCIREDRPFWCQDFLNDPATAPWHALGARSGWRASASLPLHRRGKAIGALAIYSGEVNVFDEQSRRLLTEIARAVDFALQNFDREANRQEAESALHENQERYRLLFESSLDAILLTGSNGRIYAANPAACRIFGKTEDEIIRGGRAGIADLSDPRVLRAVEERRRTGKFLGEITMLRGNGEKFPAEVSAAVFNDRNGAERTSMIIRDISERKQAEAALIESEQQFRGIVEQSIAGYYVFQDGKLTYANPRFAEILGYASPEELLGRDALSLVPESERAKVAENFRRRTSGEVKSINYTTAVIRKDGSTIDVGAHGSLASFRGRPAIIGLMQDISEKKRADEQIQRYVVQLQSAFMRTVEVAMNLSEMRDPYTAGHERRVAEIAVAIGTEMGLDAARVEGLRVAGYLHDVGKISVPAEILSKPGRLTPIELELVRSHPVTGFEVLKNVEFPWPVAQVALQHHERFDGSGYPNHLKGEDILLESRIMAVADVVEAMASHRPYRAGLGIDKALAEIEGGRGTAYDPAIVDACLRLFRERQYSIPA